MRGWFVTGTDTGVGKTFVSVALMHALRARGQIVLGMKPVASGCTRTAVGLRSDDALQLQAAGSFALPYERVNPYALEAAIAPHLAARHADVAIDLALIVAEARALRAECDDLVVEGVGGWEVPLNGNEAVSDLARRLALPVILVVGIRLGCINHALLAAAAIGRSGANLAGWVANLIDPGMEAAMENVRDLESRLDAPLMGVIPRGANPCDAGVALRLPI